ncbi:hypothetical protein SAMN06272781_8155 [Streptomyces sp. 1222.2]|nr:hypothetical protein SAMN06272781_8155 [Streptomyces sp. 1222.2]
MEVSEIPISVAPQCAHEPVSVRVDIFLPCDHQVLSKLGDKRCRPSVTKPAQGRLARQECPRPDASTLDAPKPNADSGASIRAVGERHASISCGRPDCANLGYIVDETVYHPDDALHVPDQSIETLLVPAQGSWLKMAEALTEASRRSGRRTAVWTGEGDGAGGEVMKKRASSW